MVFSAICLFAFGAISNSWGWDHHHFLMRPILSTSNPSSPPSRLAQILNQTVAIPCESENIKTYSELSNDLKLNPNIRIPALTQQSCASSGMTIYSILEGSSVDDPDHGMDQNLPSEPGNKYDPRGDRKWMGGFRGITSQGFRHMYFGGWNLTRPISTVQIPPFAIGQNPERILTIAKKAKELIRGGHHAWGVRVLAWAAHYIQDLNQPFHTVQILHTRMVPWIELLSLHPLNAFKQVKQETERIITNFHFAYEGYTYRRILQGEKSPYFECLTKPEGFSSLSFDPQTQDLKVLVDSVIQESVSLAPEVGESEMKFFGNQLLAPRVELTDPSTTLDYLDYSIRPDLGEPRRRMEKVTCRALANTSLATRYLFEWAFQP